MKMKRTAIFSRRADADFDEQSGYLAEASLDVALRFQAAVRQTCLQLAEMPRRGRAVTTGNPRLQGLRRCPVKGFENHLIFYQDLGDSVRIVRVLHGARDIEAALTEA